MEGHSATGYWWAEARAPVKLRTEYGAAPSTKNSLVQMSIVLLLKNPDLYHLVPTKTLLDIIISVLRVKNLTLRIDPGQLAEQT